MVTISYVCGGVFSLKRVLIEFDVPSQSLICVCLLDIIKTSVCVVWINKDYFVIEMLILKIFGMQKSKN